MAKSFLEMSQSSEYSYVINTGQRPNKTYRTLSFAHRQCKGLARQLFKTIFQLVRMSRILVF